MLKKSVLARLVFSVIVMMGAISMATTALAQPNPFQPRTAPEPEPEPEPEPKQKSKPQPLPEPQVKAPQKQPSVLDYELELAVLQPVAVRNGVAVIRGPDAIYFLKDGETFTYNGVDYIVGVDNRVFSLSLPEDQGVTPKGVDIEVTAEILDEDGNVVETTTNGEGAETQTAQADSKESEPMEVYSREIGREISLNAL